MKSFLTLFFILVFVATPMAHADGPIRQRLKSNIKERVAERLKDQPAPEVNASVNDRITSPGDYYFSINHDGKVRMYRVHVPPSYRDSSAAALVFAFHGGGGDMDYMAKDEYYGLISKSDKEGFVIVFPNGYSRFQSGKLATWNAGACCGDARDKNIDDVGFVRDIITHLTRQMTIDPQRVFATGMSNGGLMSYRLACEMSDVFTAIASVAGTDNTLTCQPSHPVSILHIHAQNDDHVLFNGGAGEGSFRDESKVTEFASVPETVSKWVARNQCRTTPQRVLSVNGAYCDLYTGCAGGTEVKLCVTDTGAHSWPGGYKPRGESTSQAISANDEIWRFFNNAR